MIIEDGISNTSSGLHETSRVLFLGFNPRTKSEKNSPFIKTRKIFSKLYEKKKSIVWLSFHNRRAVSGRIGVSRNL